MSAAKIAAFKRIVTEIADIVQKHTQTDLSIMLYHLDTALSLSPGTTFSSFVHDAQPYLKEICARNADFFIDMAGESTNMLEIPIAQVWELLDEGERDKIWTNVEKLIVLAEQLKP